MSEEHKMIRGNKLLGICWLIANAEAKHLGAEKIEPIHFLLGILKIIDPEFPDKLDSLDIPSQDWAMMCEEARRIRNYIEIFPNRVTTKRREIRAHLEQLQVNHPNTADGMLHRSTNTKRAFSDAIFFTDGDTLTLERLVVSFFEMGLISCADVDAKWEK